MAKELSQSFGLSRFRVVLVEPRVPENIGSVARLVENFMVPEWVLVNPKVAVDHEKIRIMATSHSQKRLVDVRVVNRFEDAVSDCVNVIGFTARDGRRRNLTTKLEDISGQLIGKTGLVFGREDYCLFKEEIEFCTHLCALDTNPDFPALNLSHSVAVVLSRLFQDEHPSRRGHRRLATQKEQEPMIRVMKEAMISVGLTNGGNPERMLLSLQKIFQRAQLSPSDAAVVTGLFSKVKRHIDFLNRKNQSGFSSDDFR